MLSHALRQAPVPLSLRVRQRQTNRNMNISFNCTLCELVIQESTSRIHGGLCAQCTKLSPACLRVRRQIASGLDPFKHTIQLYASEISKLSWSISGGYFGAIGDPMFESLRLYRFECLEGCFDFDRAVDLSPDVVDEIEDYSSEVKQRYSLQDPISQIFKTVAPSINSRGGTVFVGSWGMGPEEIALSIKHLNDRSLFVSYLSACGITEAEVDRYDTNDPENEQGA